MAHPACWFIRHTLLWFGMYPSYKDQTVYRLLQFYYWKPHVKRSITLRLLERLFTGGDLNILHSAGLDIVISVRVESFLFAVEFSQLAQREYML